MLISSGVRVRFSVWLVSGYAHAFALVSVVTVGTDAVLWDMLGAALCRGV